MQLYLHSGVTIDMKLSESDEQHAFKHSVSRMSDRPWRRKGLRFGHTALCMDDTEYLLGSSV